MEAFLMLTGFNRDFASAEIRITVKAKMHDYGRADLVHDMNEDYQIDPYSGDSCIECKVTTLWDNWGGWLFINGYLPTGLPRLLA